MRVSTQKPSVIGISKWVALFLLLSCSLNNSFSSEASTVASAIDASGEIENLSIDSELPLDGTTNKVSRLDLANAQIDWLLSKGGSVDLEKLAIQPVMDDDEEDTSDATNLGIFAIEDISEGDVLMTIPMSLVLRSRDSEDACDAAMTLLYQLEVKGNSSNFAPYLEYLYGSDEIPSIPSTWSSAAKGLLTTIQGPLMPQDLTTSSFVKDCEDDEDEIEEDDLASLEFTYAIALTRSWNEKFVPIVDMFNHHSIPNVAMERDDESRRIVVSARIDIPKGEEIYTNYREQSPESQHHVGTLLRNYGFVEDYPQQWELPTPRKRSNVEENSIPPSIKFVLNEAGSDDYEIRWIRPETPLAHPVAADHLKKELQRIQEMRSTVEETASTLPSENERNTIVDYYESLSVAYKAAIASMEEAIEMSPGVFEEEGDNFMACSDWDALHEGTYGWEHVDETESSFQEIEYYYNGETRDACLFLEQYLHACVSNRPHYHEVFVHYPAHFLEKVERVLFIGGGDSMVLHEVLKYDDQLELVVGLELDQHVVRSTYARIGTQPHFHNDKVEWWFGDAAEALNVLPTEYYGTFDLVVVDILSEVAESLKVTDEVTIMEAAMMLMKPNGIIVKNEDEGYVPGSTNARTFTNYTADVMYYDVPVYCLQTFVMGSNAIDFSTTKPYDHKISNFYLKGADEFQGQFDTWYTTGKGSADDDEEEEDDEDDEDDSVKEKSTNAMTMIIEVEEISVPISVDSALSIQGIIHSCTETVGFTEKKSYQNDFVGGFNLVSIFEEAAVTARCFPGEKYCAIDVQFWKSAEKAEPLKKELLSKLGSKENSVYRVVTTGVFGVEENDDNSKIGPPSKKSDTESAPQDDSEDTDNNSGAETTFVERENKELSFKNATFEDYDSTDALEQWHSQKPIGFQNIVRYDLPFQYQLDKLKQMMGELLHDTIKATPKRGGKSVGEIKVEDVAIGKGAVFALTWSDGDLIALWDGKKKLNIKMFAVEQSARAYASAIGKALTDFTEFASVDIFPRGTGRVINFPRDLIDEDGDGERVHPFWAPQDDDEEDEDEEYYEYEYGDDGEL